MHAGTIDFAFNYLTASYDGGNGQFENPGYAGASFWESSNAIEAMLNYAVVNASAASAFRPYVEHSFVQLKSQYFQPSPYMDDQLWWVFTWLRAYETTHSKFLLHHRASGSIFIVLCVHLVALELHGVIDVRRLQT